MISALYALNYSSTYTRLALSPYMEQCEHNLVVSTAWNSLSSGVEIPKEKERRPEWVCHQNGYRHKADRNATASK